MAKSQNFRVGKVTVYLRGQVWYLRYYEQSKRHQVRASDDKTAARQLAAQVNAQLETGAPAATSFQPITIVELRKLWLEHHEHVPRSSVATINRYRTAPGVGLSEERRTAQGRGLACRPSADPASAS